MQSMLVYQPQFTFSEKKAKGKPKKDVLRGEPVSPLQVTSSHPLPTLPGKCSVFLGEPAHCLDVATLLCRYEERIYFRERFHTWHFLFGQKKDNLQYEYCTN